MSKFKTKQEEIINKRRIFLRDNFKRYPLMQRKDWRKELAQLSYKDYWQLKTLVDGLVLRKFSNELVQKALDLDYSNLMDLNIILQNLYLLAGKAQNDEVDNPFATSLDEIAEEDRHRPQKKRRKRRTKIIDE